MYAAASSMSGRSISPGALLGTTGTAELVRSINESLGGSNLIPAAHHASMRGIRESFVREVLMPIQRGRDSVVQQVNILMNPDVIRPLIDPVDFSSVPPCMYIPIVMYPPVLNLLKQGRISGFGFDPDNLPDEDVHGRLINNGTCDDVQAAYEKHGELVLESVFYSTDPKLTFEELDALEETRESIDYILDNTRFDPTDYPSDRG